MALCSSSRTLYRRARLRAAGPKHARADVEMIAFRKDPRVAALHRPVFQMAHIGPQVGMSVAPDVRHFGFDGDGKRAFAAQAAGAGHNAVRAVRADQGIGSGFPHGASRRLALRPADAPALCHVDFQRF